MHWRPFRESDLSFCLDMQPVCVGDQIVGRNVALRVWEALVKHPAFLATVIESDRLVAISLPAVESGVCARVRRP
jgi:hypothetical protein